MVGRRAAVLMGPKDGIILKTGVAFPSPRTAITLTNCSLVTASIPFTICFTCQKRKKERKKLDFQHPYFVLFVLKKKTHLINPLNQEYIILVSSRQRDAVLREPNWKDENKKKHQKTTR